MHKTPLNAFHHDAGARMVDFAGWEMPLLYTSILEEHHHTRRHASFFDVSHMGRVEFRGPDAEALLERLNTRRIGDMKVGQCRYSHMCREDGGILDDVLVYRYEDHFLVVCNAANREKLLGWWQQQRGDGKVEVTDRTFETAMIAIQGPEAIPTLQQFSPFPIGELKRYRFTAGSAFGAPYTLSRTGYTGEDGVEVIIPAGFGDMAARTIADQSASIGRPIRPAGLGARDTLRIEAAMPLYGHELTEDWDPITAGLKWVVCLEKDFIGRDAIARVAEQGPQRQIVGLEVEGRRTPRQHDAIQKDGQTVGQVTSGLSSPTLGRVIAMGLVRSDLTEPGTELTIDLRGRPAAARVVPLPFYKPSKK